jgi:integrative and conjugative element protein (TIGR02256 family)
MTEQSLLRFDLPDGLGQLVLTAEVLEHLEAHKQRRALSKEAGGQLFADLSADGVIRLAEATGPRRTDKRSMFGYKPDRNAERIEIAERYSRGFHFVGDWHTHPQKLPEPSGTDLRSMGEMEQLTIHGLAGFFLIVVGKAKFPDGLHVSFHSAGRWTQLKPVAP